MVVVARTDPHATYDDVQAAHPDWIAVDADGRPAPPLGLAGDVGHLRPGPLQLRVHDRGEAGDHGPLPGGRHLHQPLGRVRHVLLRALPGRLPRRHRPRPPAHDGPAGPGAARLPAVAGGAALRPVAPLGLGGPQDQPRLLRHPQHRRRRHQPARHEDDRRAGADAGRRPPGAPRPHGALGHRHEREGVPRRHGPQARGRPLQRRRRGGVPLEGLRAERRRDPPLGRGPRRQRHAALVHEVRRHPARPALARSRSRRSSPGATGPSATCATSGRSPAWGSSTRSRPRGSAAATASASGSRTRRSAGTRRSSRRASRSRWSTTGCSTPATSRRSGPSILPNIEALSDRQCAQLADFVRRGGGLVATSETSLRDEWGVARSDFGLADLFGVSFAGRRPGPVAQRLPAPRARDGRAGIPCCAGSRTPRASSTARGSST